MATIPLSGSNVRLLRQVPFSNDYKHTRYFDTERLQRHYFTNKPVVHAMSRVAFQKIEGRNFIAVDKDIDSLWGVNYVMFQNSEYSDKWFYAFVTKLEYKQRNTTYVHFEIDVFQTWLFDIQFKPSFIVREHRRQFQADGSPTVNTQDEGLAYGDDYDNVGYYNFKPLDGFKWLVVISKTLLHNEGESFKAGSIKPSIIGTHQPLAYYFVPYTDSGFILPPVELPNGDYEGGGTISKILEKIYQSETAVNNIVSIYTTEHIGLDCSIKTFPNGKGIKIKNGVIKSVLIEPDTPMGLNAGMFYMEDLKNFAYLKDTIALDKYSQFRNVKETKLLMYPYSMIVLDDFKGNRVEIKPEYIYQKELQVVVRGSLGTSNKVSYHIANYNQRGPSEFQDTMVGIEAGIINNNANDIPVVTDHLASFLQGNRNSLLNQKNSIVFNGVADTVSSIAGFSQSAVLGNPAGMVRSGVGAVQGAGNSVLAIQGMLAKQKDINNLPPQIAKMGSNTAYDFGNRFNGVFIMYKQIKSEYQKKLEDFFNMYGYKVNEVKGPNWHTRKYWNYIQTESCVITGNFNNEDLQEIKNVFDGGITLWHTDDIGNYYLDNEVL